MEDSHFARKVVVITGGSSGIGKQVAADLLSLGARVIIVSDEPAKLDLAHIELQTISPSVDAIVCDVREQDQVDGMAREVLEKYQHVDILINNAGYAVYRPFEESCLTEVLDIVDVNLLGAMRCTKAFLSNMVEQRSGRIVNISSLAGEMVITPNAAYCAAKHGMVAWTKAIRYELAPFNVAANVVCPNYVKTNFHDDPSFRRRAVYRKKNEGSLKLETVSMKILDAIRKDRIVTLIPAQVKLIVWALNAVPFIVQPVWDRLMRKRIVQLYEQIELEKQTR